MKLASRQAQIWLLVILVVCGAVVAMFTLIFKCTTPFILSLCLAALLLLLGCADADTERPTDCATRLLKSYPTDLVGESRPKPDGALLA